jgi:predicted phage terminase large subunit-like protein
MEVTEQATANLLTRNDCRSAAIESNNGGRGFARNVQRLAPRVKVEWFHQSGNKESRILSNSATVQHNILLPSDWSLRFPLFYAHLTAFKRLFRANSHDDCADAITGIAEREYQTKKRITMICN